jgi:L-rhamnose mutarotase
MIRRAFTMRLKPDALAEYKHHHDNIWPELVAEIERAGIASITTFQRELDLFLVSEIADEAAWDKLWNSDLHKRWAEVMQPLMHLRDDGIVDAGELNEVFHLTTNGHAVSAKVILEPPHEPSAAPPAKHSRKVATRSVKKTNAKKKAHPHKAAAKKSTGKKAPGKKASGKKSAAPKAKAAKSAKKSTKKAAGKKSKQAAKKKR